MNNEEKFIEYLKYDAKQDNGIKGLAESTQQTIFSNIKTSIPNELSIESLFNIKDIVKIKEYEKMIIGTNFDKKRKNSPKQALKFYIKFLNHKTTDSVIKDKIQEQTIQPKENSMNIKT